MVSDIGWIDQYSNTGEIYSYLDIMQSCNHKSIEWSGLSKFSCIDKFAYKGAEEFTNKVRSEVLRSEFCRGQRDDISSRSASLKLIILVVLLVGANEAH